MASTIPGTVGDIFASVALCIVVVTELICLFAYPVLARLVHQKDICHKVYPQDAFKVGAVGTTFWGFTMIVIFLPTFIILLGWHRRLDHHPLACLIIYLVLAIFCFITLTNMFVSGLMFGVSIIFPLHFETIFTKRRSILLIVLLVWLTPIAVVTPFFLVLYENNGYSAQQEVQCLAGLHYWPAWTKHLTVFGFFIPVMTEAFVIHFYVLFVAWKQSKRQVIPEARPAPALTTAIANNSNCSLETLHVDSGHARRTKKSSNRWKGTWMIILLVCSVIFFLIPVGAAMILSAVCDSCIPQDVAYTFLMLVFAVTPLGPIAYNLMHQRSRAAVKDTLVTMVKYRHRHQGRSP